MQAFGVQLHWIQHHFWELKGSKVTPSLFPHLHGQFTPLTVPSLWVTTECLSCLFHSTSSHRDISQEMQAFAFLTNTYRCEQEPGVYLQLVGTENICQKQKPDGVHTVLLKPWLI